jgi:hypothetical protein
MNLARAKIVTRSANYLKTLGKIFARYATIFRTCRMTRRVITHDKNVVVPWYAPRKDCIADNRDNRIIVGKIFSQYDRNVIEKKTSYAIIAGRPAPDPFVIAKCFIQPRSLGFPTRWHENCPPPKLYFGKIRQ